MNSFSWQTPEYVYTEKTQDWYWTVGIISAALVVTSIIFGNILFALIIAIGAFSLALFASRKPRIVSVDITERGITIDKMLYQFAALQSFSLDEEHFAGPRLLLKSKKVVMPLISVPVVGGNHDELREFLAKHLTEESFQEGFLQTLFERLGF